MVLTFGYQNVMSDEIYDPSGTKNMGKNKLRLSPLDWFGWRASCLCLCLFVCLSLSLGKNKLSHLRIGLAGVRLGLDNLILQLAHQHRLFLREGFN